MLSQLVSSGGGDVIFVVTVESRHLSRVAHESATLISIFMLKKVILGCYTLVALCLVNWCVVVVMLSLE